MPLGLKNTCVTYQRLVDAVFLKQIERNMKVYMDYMNLKSLDGESHCANLEGIMELDKRYNMHLNSVKFSFDIQTDKFIRFILTRRRIEANLDKY